MKLRRLIHVFVAGTLLLVGTHDASTSRDFGNVNLFQTRRGTQVEWPRNKATGVVLKRQTLMLTDFVDFAQVSHLWDR